MQTPIVSHKWSARQFIPGQSAKETYEVSGVASDTEAISAVGIGYLASHPQDARLIVPPSGITVAQDTSTGPMIYRVTYDYTTNAILSVGTPLDEPADVSLDFVAQGVQIEQDADGNLITNSARYPYENGVPDEDVAIHVTIAQWESGFDTQKAIAYTSSPRATLNAGAITIPRIGLIQPLQMKLSRNFFQGSIRALASDPSQPYVKVIYQGEIRGYRTLEDGTTISGFARRIADKGPQGTYADSNGAIKKGPIVFPEPEKDTGRWVAVPDDVRLDGYGGVFDYPEHYVTSGDVAQGTFGEPPPGATLEETDTACFLYWLTNKSMPFAALGWRFK